MQSKSKISCTGAAKRPKCLVLSGFGLNSEAELAHAFMLAGAEPHIIHLSDISKDDEKLSKYEIFAIPGGWSYGDNISAGKVLSNKLKNSIWGQFEEFLRSGKPILGVCNGFQVLVKMGAIPDLSGSFLQEATLACNKSGRFEDRWVYLKPQKSRCKYFEGIDFIHCPVRHGEGQFVPKSQKVLDGLLEQGLVPIRYCDEWLDDKAGYPYNPNGSVGNIAGICNKAGNVLGLMPHIECAVYPHHFPRFTAGVSYEKKSLRFFENIVNEARRFL